MSDSIISLNGDILAKNGRILKSLNGGGGSSYSAGPGIDITSNTISVKYDGLLTTENQIEGNYSDGRFDRVDHFEQPQPFRNFGDIQQYLVQDRTYTVKLASHHNGDWEQGRGYAVSKSSTSLTWNGMIIMMVGFKWDDTGYIDVSQGWDYEDGATEESWADTNISNCQLQLTDDVTGDVYYTNDFYYDELLAFYASDGKLKVRIDKGQSDNQFLRWSPEQQKWYATDVSIPENIVMRDRMAATSMGHTPDFTSNSITVNPASHDQHFESPMEIQNWDYSRAFKILCSCGFDNDIQATSNAATLGRIVFKSKNDSNWSYTFTVRARQTYSYNSNDAYSTINIVTDEYSLPFPATIGEPWAGDIYIDSVSFYFDGLEEGGTALTADSFGMGAIVNEWSFN